MVDCFISHSKLYSFSIFLFNISVHHSFSIFLSNIPAQYSNILNNHEAPTRTVLRVDKRSCGGAYKWIEWGSIRRAQSSLSRVSTMTMIAGAISISDSTAARRLPIANSSRARKNPLDCYPPRYKPRHVGYVLDEVRPAVRLL